MKKKVHYPEMPREHPEIKRLHFFINLMDTLAYSYKYIFNIHKVCFVGNFLSAYLSNPIYA